MNPVNWFEIPVSDIDRAKKFYEDILGIKMSLMEIGGGIAAMFPGNPEVPGTSGSLFHGEGYSPSYSGSIVYISVADMEKVLNNVNKKGGETLIPKISIGEHGFIAHFQDCEGNRVGLHSMT